MLSKNPIQFCFKFVSLGKSPMIFKTKFVADFRTDLYSTKVSYKLRNKSVTIHDSSNQQYVVFLIAFKISIESENRIFL